MPNVDKKTKKSFFDNPLLSTKIKKAKVTFFPELLLGYLGAPILALISNAILNTYLVKYYTDVLGLTSNGWAGLFGTLLPIVSAIFVVIGNLVVGKLMDKVKTKAGKARPMLILSLPLLALAIFSLFFAPFPDSNGDISSNIWTLIIVAVGYNLYYAIAYPFYYTSHSALVNLSTRDSSGRSLLATGSNAAMVAAAGLAGMVFPYLQNLVFVPATYDEAGNIASYDTYASYQNWKIFMIALIVVTVIGIVLEFYFTRERITEEEFANRDDAVEDSLEEEEEGVSKKKAVKGVPMGKQIKVCMQDKYWWMLMLFLFLYQLGGQFKNNSVNYYSVAWFGSGNMAGTINILGAIPTSIGMLIIWPLANKFGKSNSVKVGAIIACACGLIGFIDLGTTEGNTVIAITAFVLKSIGSIPAMYVSLALLADVLDHQEAMHGFRTDGFSMAVYGSIMIAMTGIVNGIIVGLLGAAGYSATQVTSSEIKTMTTWLFFGFESIAYGLIFFLLLGLNVEKYSKLDQIAIEADKKHTAELAGEEYIPAAVRLEMQQKESEAQLEQERLIQLKIRCEKKGLSFEEEEAKYQEQLAAKKAIAEEKKAAADAIKAEKEAIRAEKEAAMSQDELDARAAKLEKKRLQEEELLKVYNEQRQAIALKEGRDYVEISYGTQA